MMDFDAMNTPDLIAHAMRNAASSVLELALADRLRAALTEIDMLVNECTAMRAVAP